MPIAVTCPGCSAKMRAPDTAAGKKVSCPKCKSTIAVAAADAPADFEVVDDEPAVLAKKPAFGSAAAKPPVKVEVKAELVEDEPPKQKAKAAVEEDDDQARKKKRQVEDDEAEEMPKKKAKAVAGNDDEDENPRKKTRAADDDDDEEDDRPKKKAKAGAENEDEDEKPRKKKRAADDEDDEDERPKKKKKKKRAADDEGGTSMARNIIGGVVLVIMLGVVGYVYYDKYGKKDEKPSETKTDPPSGPPAGPPNRPSRPPNGVTGPPDGFQVPRTAENELKRLQGDWQVVSAIKDGERAKSDEIKSEVFRFDGNKLIPLDNKLDEVTFVLNPTQQPATIDLSDNTGDVMRGIYKFTGEDKLTICYRSDAKKPKEFRPKEFDASKGSGARMFELERIKTK